MAFHKGFIASAVALLPDVTISSSTNFNQNQATLNATVSWNLYPTTVYFDYSTSSSFSSYSTVTYGSVTSQNASVSSTVTGLSVGTLYYVRVRAVSQIGTTTSSSTSFTTWSLQTYLKSTSGSYSVSVPSIPGVAPTIYEMLIYGGGGGGPSGSAPICSAAGGGGAVRIIWPGNTRSFPSTCAGSP